MGDDSVDQNAGNSAAKPQRTALWRPAWHELDQTLVLGLRQRYFFFDDVPESMSKIGSCESPDYVFFNGVDSSENSQIRFAKIVNIEHATLGEMLRVDTFGLDYILYPVSGEEIIIDGEEEAGVVRSGTSQQVSDWTMVVTLEEISERIRHEDLA